MKQQYPDRKVIMVTKDVNLRLKAKSLDLNAEDYETGKIKNVNDLHTGHSVVEKVKPSVIDEISTRASSTRGSKNVLFESGSLI